MSSARSPVEWCSRDTAGAGQDSRHAFGWTILRWSVHAAHRVEDRIEDGSVERRALASHGGRVELQHPIESHLARPAGAIPRARTDIHPVPSRAGFLGSVAVMVLARQGQGQHDALDLRVARDDENGSVLALRVIFLVRHPGPDDLARVRTTVVLRLPTRGRQRAVPVTSVGERARIARGRGSLTVATRTLRRRDRPGRRQRTDPSGTRTPVEKGTYTVPGEGCGEPSCHLLEVHTRSVARHDSPVTKHTLPRGRGGRGAVVPGWNNR